MQIRDLGPLVVEQDGLPSAMGSGRLAAVLSPLANQVGDVVSTAALVEAVWGQDVPGRATQLLESLVWRLRKQLEPGRTARAESAVLRRHPVGYRLELPGSSVDSARLRAALAQVRELSAREEHQQVLDSTARVLPLWRGEPYAEVPDTGWLHAARGELGQVRMDLAELRIQSLLAAGRPEEVIGELGPLLAEHPFRERLWGHRMLALYRAGRQAEALAAYGQARDLLGEELGVDPGPDLRALQQQILGHDPQLDLRPTGRVSWVPAERLHLPRRRGAMVGRQDDLTRLGALTAEHPLVCLVGPGGAGKTRLAIEVGYGAAERFPDGVWFVDLASVGDAGLLSTIVATALGLADQPGVAPLDLVTGFLADRRAMLVLDNCEHLVAASGELVEAVLDRCPAVRILATTREPLELAGEQRYAVPPLPVRADNGGVAPAAALFAERAGPSVDLDLAGADADAVRRICEAVEGLPLGIELAAAATRTFELAEIADALEGNPAVLARPGGGGPQRQATLRDAVDWGYRLARRDEQALHRRLAVVPGAFTLDVAAALCDLPPLRAEQAMELVGGLVHRSLLTASRAVGPGRASTFSQLAPVRAHAAGELAGDEREVVETTRDRWLAARLAAAPPDGRADVAPFLDWLDDNAATVRATVESVLVSRPDPSAIAIVGSLVGYWYERGRFTEAAHWAPVLAQLPRRVACDPLDQALVDVTVGSVLAFQHRADEAGRLLLPALEAVRRPSADRLATAARLVQLAAAAAWTGDAWEAAEAYVAAGLDLGTAHDLPHLVIVCRAIQAANWALSSNRDAGIAQATQVLADNEPLDNDLAALFALVALTITALVGGQPQDALDASDRLLLTHRRMGSLAVGDTVETRASIRAAAGDPAGAVRCLGAASALSERLGRDWPWHEFTAPVLADLRAGLDSAEFERHWSSGERLGRGSLDRFTPEWI